MFDFDFVHLANMRWHLWVLNILPFWKAGSSAPGPTLQLNHQSLWMFCRFNNRPSQVHRYLVNTFGVRKIFTSSSASPWHSHPATVSLDSAHSRGTIRHRSSY